MRFYIVDDDINVVLILKNIIEEKNLGTVIGHECDSKSAYEEIMEDLPDIVLVDYLMPKLDGNSLVKQVVERQKGIRFIMISQVSDQQLVSDVYEAGIEFFIHKPINVMEVESVIKSVSEKIAYAKKFNVLKGLIQDTDSVTSNGKGSSAHDTSSRIDNIKRILSEIAVLGEKGTADILSLCERRLNGHKSTQNMSINQYCQLVDENPKIVKQRMRRAVAVGLRNIAHIGIEDNLNDSFVRYANKLFDYEDIRLEMELLRGKRTDGGRINIEKFIENLILLSKYY